MIGTMRISSLAKVAAWGLAGTIVFVTVCPINLRPVTETTVDLDRALAFAATGGVFALAYPRRWWLMLFVLPFAAFGIEALQFLAPTRHPQLPDAAFKAAGAAVGILLGRLVSGWLDTKVRHPRFAD
jgi:VanZ family protein